MESISVDKRGCPRIFKAAYMLFVNPALKMDSAMEIAKFSRREIGRRSIRKAISKKMNRLKEQARKAAHAQNMRNRRQSTAVTVTEVTVGGTTITGTTLSDITNSDITNSTALSAHSNQMGTKKKAKAVHKSSKRAFAKVQLSQSSRRTPNQVVKADVERAQGINQLQRAYEWAVNEASNHKNKVSLAKIASEKFNVTIVPQTLRKLIREGRTKIMPPGPKPVMDEMEYKTISAALSSCLAVSQVNGDPEKNRKDLLTSLELLLKGKKIKAETVFKKFKKENAALLDISKEQVVEMRRLMWATPKNLSDWFDEWEHFVLAQGFATKDDNGLTVFSEDQKRRIINIDETNLSLDGSDGGRGGRPSNTITIKGCQRPGTGQNKAGLSSSLMCGSNAAGEPMPLHIMFSSSAAEEKNYAVNASWLVGLPRVHALFGHEEEQCFPATVTTNE